MTCLKVTLVFAIVSFGTIFYGASLAAASCPVQMKTYAEVRTRLDACINSLRKFSAQEGCVSEMDAHLAAAKILWECVPQNKNLTLKSVGTIAVDGSGKCINLANKKALAFKNLDDCIAFWDFRNYRPPALPADDCKKPLVEAVTAFSEYAKCRR